MQYHSTRGASAVVDSAQAVLTGLAPDGGLYLPEQLPAFDWQKCVASSAMEMAEQILSAFLPDIPDLSVPLYQSESDPLGLPHKLRL